MKKNEKKGFTLIELLATVCIISVVLFIGSRLVTNTIHDTQETSEDLSLANVKKGANIYVKENPDEVIWQDSEVGTYSCVKLQTLINKGFLKETITQDTKLESNTYIIVKKDERGNILSEEFDDHGTCLPKGSCSILYTGDEGDNGWYKTLGKVELKIQKLIDDDINSFGLSTSSTETFNNQNILEQNDTIGTKYYGYVEDIYGNHITCEKEIKVDTVSPTCTSSGGNSNWTNQNVTLTGTCAESDGSGCVGNVTKTFTEEINTNNASTGAVKDYAGNTVECPADQTVKIDKTAPSKPSIYNPTNGQKVNYSFSLTISSSDSGSGIAYWQYRYSGTNWTTYSNSSQDTFTTTPFSAARNELAYIRACDNAGNCSEASSTKIYISYKSASVINNNYYVCPNDQNVPTPSQCATGQYNTMYVSGVSVSGTNVSLTVRLHVNNTSVTWDGSNPTRTICLANTSNQCVINLRSFSIGSSSWTSKGANPINQTFSFNVSGLSAGTYRIIVTGGSAKFRWQTTSYMKNTIQVSG